MPDKKLTEVDASTTLADNDKLFGNISNAVKQITLTDLVIIIKNKIGSLKNPNKLKFTGAVTNEYDGSKEVTINIPENSGGSYTLPTATSTTLGGVKPVSKTSEMSQDVGVDKNGKLYTVPGNGNDGLSVSYDEETQTLKFTSSSGGGDLKNLLSNTVRYIEVDGEILEISNEKQWTKIAEITVQENDSVYEYTDLDNLTEIFIYAVGLCNMTTTASVLQARINDEAFPFGTLDTQIASGSATRYQRLYLKYNELYWDASKGQVSSNEQNYYGQFTFFYNPYSVKLGVNKCTKLTLTSNARYNLKSGTIYIYGR